MSSLSEPRRPRLLPQNRKLRHLKGISLRNVCLTPTHLRTTDDAALILSPGKLDVLRETGQLQASRSSENLRSDGARPEKLTRPPNKTRRTSMTWTHASPMTRQKRLEGLINEAAGDVFFSLHVAEDQEPVYISEVRERSANFNFQFFDLASDAPEVARACITTIRVWVRRQKQEEWTFLLEEMIDLRKLNFIGTLMDRKFPSNALIFHLEDGVYSLDFPNRVGEPRKSPAIATSTYNALMKLANLESSIDDAVATQRNIMQQINEILEASADYSVESAQEEVVLAEKYVATQKRANRLAQKRRDELRESIQSRKESIAKGREVQKQAEEDIANNREKLAHSESLVEETRQQLRGQRRRICANLCDVFPITPIPNAPPLSFSICNIQLTNSIYDAATSRVISEDALSAGLGFVALLTNHLQFYLSHPLPYPLTPIGSRSYARDDISQLVEKQVSRREFPLYLPRGGSVAGQWRFEYAWFLLNKNIEALCASQGLKVVDIRHTLPNLKYLLYVCSAGSEDVPERKRGGVRGLWAARFSGKLSSVPTHMEDEIGSGGGSSRRGSVDSDMDETPGHKTLISRRNANGKGLAAEGHGNEEDDDTPLPFAESETKFTLRTKGMRENR